MKRDRTIRFRVNNDEYDAIESRAIGNISSWLRDLALGQKLRIKPKTIDPELLFQLNKIGVNLNQIARYCNSQKDFNSVDKVDLFSLLASIENELKALREKYDR